MVYSMTAYAGREISLPFGVVRWEIRSMNHRYLELSFKLPDFLRDLEYNLRDIARNALNRGKVECTLRFEPIESEQEELTINFKLVDKLMEASQKIMERLPTAPTLSLFDILRWPSVMKISEKNWSNLSEPLSQSFVLVLKDLSEARAREGSKLQQLIQERLVKMRERIHTIYQSLPSIESNYRKKLKEKIDELKVQVDESRFEQEMIYWAQKMDVSEEIDRLQTHLTEVERVLKSEKVVGRRLDFLMQELNREANTLASKIDDNSVVQHSIDLKVLIEEMREQIQNLE